MNHKSYLPADSRAPVDEVLPGAQLTLLGLQHVLVMYAGVVTAPLVIGGALGLARQEIAFLISAALFVAGLVSLIQTVGFRGFGIKLPVMMGVSFTGVGPMLAIGANPDLGLNGIYGSMLVAGLIGIFISPLMGRMLRFFPPVVMGTEILMVGLSLMTVSANWAAGGIGNPEYGALRYIGIAFMVLLFILLVVKYARGLVANMAVLMGIIFGLALSVFSGVGVGDWDTVREAPWIGLEVAIPFKAGVPRFDVWAITAMTIVMIVTFIESTGMFVAVGETVKRPVNKKSIVHGFRADGAGFVLGSVFNIFPYTSYAENIGLVSITGVRSRWVCAAAGGILILLGLLPKMSAIVATVPYFVLGGAGTIMFGMITASGIHMLSRVDFTTNRFNAYIVAISIAVGMLPVVAEDFFNAFPEQLAPLLHSPILLTALTAIALNLFFNGASERNDYFALSPKPGEAVAPSAAPIE